MLARESDAVLAAILALAGRHRHMVGANLLTIRSDLVAATMMVDELLPAAGLLRGDNAGG